jgi:hypothetical protein
MTTEITKPDNGERDFDAQPLTSDEIQQTIKWIHEERDAAKNATEKSPREIAEAMIHGVAASFERKERGVYVTTRFDALAEEIDKALRDRDERAAKIADAEHARLYHGVDYGDEDDSPAFRIASAIRGTNK